MPFTKVDDLWQRSRFFSSQKTSLLPKRMWFGCAWIMSAVAEQGLRSAACLF